MDLIVFVILLLAGVVGTGLHVRKKHKGASRWFIIARTLLTLIYGYVLIIFIATLMCDVLQRY